MERYNIVRGMILMSAKFSWSTVVLSIQAVTVLHCWKTVLCQAECKFSFSDTTYSAEQTRPRTLSTLCSKLKAYGKAKTTQ